MKVKKFLELPEFSTVEKETEPQRVKRAYRFPTAFSYPTNSPIHDRIVLEINSFSTPTPTEEIEISSLIADVISKDGNIDILNELEMTSFKVTVLQPERAFCEKILALRRASHYELDYFSSRARHLYDIHQLMQSERIQAFLSDKSRATELMLMAYSDDEANQRLTETVGNDFPLSPIWSTPMETIKKIESAYNALKEITFDGTIPTIEEVGQSLTNIHIAFSDLKLISLDFSS